MTTDRLSVHPAFMSDGPIGFDVFNLQKPEAGPVIYVSTDPKWGRLSVGITNHAANTPITFGVTSRLLVVFDGLLSDEQVELLTVPDASPWVGTAVPDDLGVHFSLQPKPGTEITIAPNQKVAAEFDNALASVTANGTFRFQYLNVAGVADGYGDVPGFVQNTPTLGNLSWNLQHDAVARDDYLGADKTIYVSREANIVANYFLLNIYHGEGGTLPVPTGAKPKITFSFVTGDATMALCSADELKVVTATIAGQSPVGHWQDPEKIETKTDTTWSVEPVAGGTDLFPVGGLLQVRFDGIVSFLPPEGTTPVMVAFTDLPGYDDGYFEVMLTRAKPLPFVREFYMVSEGQRVPNGSEIVWGQSTLHWDIFGTARCMLNVTGQARELHRSVDSMPAPLELKAVTYTLEPHIDDPPFVPYPIEFTLAPPTASGTYVFTSGPGQPPPIQFPWSLTVTWTTRSARTCRVHQLSPADPAPWLPWFGTISTAPRGTWKTSGETAYNLPGDPDLSHYPIQIDVENAAGAATVDVKGGGAA